MFTIDVEKVERTHLSHCLDLWVIPEALKQQAMGLESSVALYAIMQQCTSASLLAYLEVNQMC